MSTKTGFCKVKNTELYYEVTGEGEAMVMVHAGIADHRMWETQVAHFAPHYQTITYDVRGFGQSMNPAGEYADHEDLRQLLDHLGVESAILIACSNGGKIAINFTLAYPERVKKLIVVGTSVSGFPHSDEVKAAWQWEEEAYENAGIYAATEVNLRTWVDGKGRTPDQLDLTMREKVREMILDTFKIPEELDCGDAQDLEPLAINRLHEILAPTLVIVGDLDFDDKIKLSQQMASTLADCQLHIMNGVAHLPNMEQPVIFNNLVQSFLQA